MNMVTVSSSIMAKLVLIQLLHSGADGLGGIEPLTRLPEPKNLISSNITCDPETGNGVRLSVFFQVRNGRARHIGRFEVIRNGTVHRTQRGVPIIEETEDVSSALRRLSPVVNRLMKSMKRAA